MGSSARVEAANAIDHSKEYDLYDDRAKPHFHLLSQERTSIEAEIGLPLQWKGLPSDKERHVHTGFQPADYALRDRWPQYHDWLADNAEAYLRVFAPRIRDLKAETWKGSEVASDDAA